MATCGRCGTSLALASLAIDVHPPRASARAKRWRRFLPAGRFAFGRQLGELARQMTGFSPGDGPASPVLLRLVVPGWAQAFLGHARRGKWFLGAYLGCLLLGLLMLGSPLGSVWLGLALAVHLSSALDVVMVGAAPSRISRCLLCCILLVVGIYVPAIWLGSQLASPRRILQPLGVLQAGDVVLVDLQSYRWRRPEPGEVVLYNAVPAHVPGRYGLRNAQYRIDGERIDRILAGPGQVVELADDRLLVDGQRVEYAALNPQRVSANLKLTVPKGCYLILPSTALAEQHNLQRLDWQSIGLIPAEQIEGKVWLRNYPFWRFWWLG